MNFKTLASLFLLLPIQLFSQKGNYIINENSWLFLRVDNQMKLGVESVPFSEIIVKTSDGENLKVDSLGRFILRPEYSRIGVKAYHFSNKDSILLCEEKFKVKGFPSATAYFGSPGKEKIELKEFHAQFGLQAELLNYDYNIRFPIKKFTIIILNDNGLVYLKDCEGGKFEEEMKTDLKRLLKGGERVFFTNIEIESPYHFEKWTNSIEVKIKTKQE